MSADRIDPARSLRMIRHMLILCGVGLACFSASPAWAGIPTDQVKTSVDQVIQILQDPALKEESRASDRRAAIRKVAESLFDFAETGKRALGQHWQSLSESQQREFVSLFTDLLERSYIARIEKYGGERIVYEGDSIDGELATVKTKFVTKQGTEIPVDYRLLRSGDRWLVYDVFVEGISLVGNYRAQFDRIMRTSSYQELARRMRASNAEFAAPGASSSGTRTPRS
jgi:phospholipid transport system substrate-binding protein